MNFEQPPKLETTVGAKKNPDGTMDYSHAATYKLSEEQAEKLAKSSEKQNREKQEGFDWEKSLKARFVELSSKSSRQGLSEHGEYEYEKLKRVMDTLRES